MNARLLALLALLLFAAPPRAVGAQGPPSSSARDGSAWISDETGALDAATRARLDAVIADAWTRTRTRLAVALVRDTGAQPIEAFALDRFRQLELGEATGGHGALLVVATETRRNRIEVGTATREVIPDSTQRYILDEVFRPTARAQGPAVATLRAVETLRDRLAERLEAVDARLPEEPEPGFQERFDRWIEPYRKTIPLAVFAAMILFASWALRKGWEPERKEQRKEFAARVKELRGLSRYFREVRAEGRTTPPSFGAREAASISPQLEPVEAFLAPLERRVEASKRIWGLAQAHEIGEVTWLVKKAIKSAEAQRSEFARLGALIAALDNKVSTTTACVKKAETAHAAAVRRWPRARHDAQRADLDRLAATLAYCVSERERLAALVKLDIVESVIEHGLAYRMLDDALGKVAADAVKAERRSAEFGEATGTIVSLRNEIDIAEPSKLRRRYREPCAAQIANLEGAWKQASRALEAGDDPRVVLAALVALQGARVQFESAPSLPPTRPFNATSINAASIDVSSSSEGGSSEGGSSDCASSDCASSDCASSDCASSDCASSDCASSDCGSSDCGSSDCSSSDCSGSSSDW